MAVLLPHSDGVVSLDQADLEILVLDYSKRRDSLQGPPDSEAFTETGRLGVK